MERPLASKRPIGPFAQTKNRTVTEILVQGSIDENADFEQIERIISNINDKSNIIKIARQSAAIEYVESLDKTVFVIPIGDEHEASTHIEFIQFMRHEGFEDIMVAVGDPDERMELILELSEQF